MAKIEDEMKNDPPLNDESEATDLGKIFDGSLDLADEIEAEAIGEGIEDGAEGDGEEPSPGQGVDHLV